MIFIDITMNWSSIFSLFYAKFVGKIQMSDFKNPFLSLSKSRQKISCKWTVQKQDFMSLQTKAMPSRGVHFTFCVIKVQ